MRVLSISLLLAVMVLFGRSFHGQDKFEATRLTSDPAQEGFPTWSPDGRSILFSHFSWDDTLGKNGIWKISLNDNFDDGRFA